MRIIRFKLKSDTKTLLAEIANENAIYDQGYAEDLYALMRLKGKGFPTDSRIKQISRALAKKTKTSETTVSILMKKRRQQLRLVTSCALFRAYALRKDTISSMRSLLTALQMVHKKVRQAQCISCTLLSQCEFGKTYSPAVKDISLVLDADYTKKVHADCPSLPEIDAANKMALAADAFSQVFRAAREAERNAMLAMGKDNPSTKKLVTPLSQAEMDAAAKLQKKADEEAAAAEQDDSSQDTDTENSEQNFYATTFTGEQAHADEGYEVSHVENNLHILEKLVSSLHVGNLALFDLGKKFSTAMTAQKEGKFAPTPQLDKSSESAKMKNVSDISKLRASQHGLPQEVFDAKLDKKQLVKRQNVKPEAKKKRLYTLVDSSGSVSGWLGNGEKTQILTRASLAITLVLALARRVRDDKGIMFNRFFERSPSMLTTASSPAEFDILMHRVATNRFNGPGTNILAALSAAVQDILRADKFDEMATTEILLVTDAEDSFDESGIRNIVRGYEFNVLDISGKAFSAQGSSGQLKRVAQKYYKADESTLDPNKIVQLI